MSSVLTKTSGLAIAVAAAMMLSSGSAQAQNGATVYIDFPFGCGVFNADGIDDNNAVQLTAPEAVVQGVVTLSGSKKFTCNGNILDSDPLAATPSNRAILYSSDDDGAGPCILPDADGGQLFSNDWQQVLTKSGRASLTCVIKGTSE